MQSHGKEFWDMVHHLDRLRTRAESEVRATERQSWAIAVLCDRLNIPLEAFRLGRRAELPLTKKRASLVLDELQGIEWRQKQFGPLQASVAPDPLSEFGRAIA